MNTETNTIAIPRKVFREIRWHLKHFNDLDDYIKTRENQLREELFDYYHFTNKNSLKNIHSYGYTVENCIIALDEDRLIRRYKKWKYKLYCSKRLIKTWKKLYRSWKLY